MTVQLTDLVDRFEAARQAQLAASDELQIELPVRYLRQQAHLTTPATNPRIATKAIGAALQTAEKLMGRYEISRADLAERLELPVADVDRLLDGDPSAPGVVVDLEDGVAPGAAEEARAQALEVLTHEDWGSGLRMLRPSGIGDDRSVRDVVEVISGAADFAARTETALPIDAIVFPKVKHVADVEWMYELLDRLETAHELEPGQIRVIYLIETAWSLQNLQQLVTAGRSRLAGMVLGPADLSADLQLPEVRYRHALCDFARHLMVSAAGAVGVPAIDGMTMNFPVAAGVAEDEQKDFVLGRMRENFDDTRHSLDVGFAGRWVGHPLQLLASLLAFPAVYTREALESEVASVEEFARAIADNKGAVAGAQGELLDIATDRQSRGVLRRAAAWGLMPTAQARELGVITAAEEAELS
ncbi:MAG TPA: aldolase/citrate lyase family protein [Solirubrobacterales bacterium]|jgi:citrate lyase subunit beta/citryl-CoA lyase